ncbi:MAG TPA: hypothetical protein DCP91_09210 [Eggerthellaceae bacterium]|nr:hypothetical protein [Eggerthellaceae bacterium]
MSKKKHKAPKSNRFVVMSSYEATMAQKPRYDGFAVGHGAHGKRGYDRNAQKRDLARELGKSSSLRFVDCPLYGRARTGPLGWGVSHQVLPFGEDAIAPVSARALY